MKKLVLIFGMVLFARICFSQDTGDVLAPDDFLSQVLAFIKSFGGLSMVLKIAGIVTLIISTMKVSILNQLIWSKLGKLKAWLAPFLGLVAGVLMLSIDNHAITLAAVMAYVASGGGAIYLHELLDTIKGIPGLGQFYVSAIDSVEKMLGGPAAQREQLNAQLRKERRF